MPKGGKTMARYTEKAILQTFEEMIGEMPFDKITVSALTKRCDISPNTFYYHYTDIYELLEHWFQMAANRFLDARDANEGWENTFKAVLKELKAHPEMVYHISDSLSREYLEKYVYDSLHGAITHLAEKQNTNIIADETTINSIVDIMSYALLGFFLRFVSSRMTIDENAVIDGISRAFNGIMEVYVLSSIMGGLNKK